MNYKHSQLINHKLHTAQIKLNVKWNNTTLQIHASIVYKHLDDSKNSLVEDLHTTTKAHSTNYSRHILHLKNVVRH